MEGAPPDSMAGDECDRQGQQIWRIEGEGGTAYPSSPEDQRFNRDVGLVIMACIMHSGSADSAGFY